MVHDLQARERMLQETMEPAWLDAFEAVPGRCARTAGEAVAGLSKSRSQAILPGPARLAAACGGHRGSSTRAGTMTHRPGGLALAFPVAGRVDGTLLP